MELNKEAREIINKRLSSIYQNKEFSEILNLRKVEGLDCFYNLLKSLKFKIANFRFLDKDVDVNKLTNQLGKGIIPIFSSLNKYEYRSTELATIILDLKRDNWAELKKEQRTAIRKAKKDGLEAFNSEDKAEWEEFKDILKELQTRKNHQFRKNIGFYLNNLFSKKHLRKLFLAKKDKEIIGGGMFLLGKNIMVYDSSGIKREHYKKNPMPLVLWQAIEWGKENGFEYFDLGGYALDAKEGSQLHRINKFKLSFGGVIVRYKVYYPKKYLYYLKKIKDMIRR